MTEPKHHHDDDGIGEVEAPSFPVETEFDAPDAASGTEHERPGDADAAPAPADSPADDEPGATNADAVTASAWTPSGPATADEFWTVGGFTIPDERLAELRTDAVRDAVDDPQVDAAAAAAAAADAAAGATSEAPAHEPASPAQEVSRRSDEEPTDDRADDVDAGPDDDEAALDEATPEPGIAAGMPIEVCDEEESAPALEASPDAAAADLEAPTDAAAPELEAPTDAAAAELEAPTDAAASELEGPSDAGAAGDEFAGVTGVAHERRPADASAAEPRRRSPAAERRRRAVTRALNRSFGTVAALALVAGAVYALGWMPLPRVEAVPEGLELAPIAGDQVRVCPGPLQQAGLNRDANANTAVGTPDYEVNMAGVRPTAKELVWQGPAKYVFPATGGDLVRATVAQSLLADTDKTKGFTATDCIQPASTHWLVAGSTEVGHSLLVDIVNPSERPARVNFTVFTSSGIATPGLGEIIVEPGERQLVSLLGAAPDQTAVAVKVTSTGGDVAAFVHETITSTTTPKGADIVGPTALPATTQILPGMWIDERPGAHDPTAPTNLGGVVRILNPSGAAAPTTMEVLDEQGAVVFSEQFDLPPQIVADYPIGGLAAGNYTVRVVSDAPIVIAGRSATVNPSDFAWVPSSSSLDDRETVPVPNGPSPRLAVANPTAAMRTVTIAGAEYALAPGATVSVTVDPGLVELVGVADLVAAIHYGTGDEFASLPAVPGNSDGAALTVHD